MFVFQFSYKAFVVLHDIFLRHFAIVLTALMWLFFVFPFAHIKDVTKIRTLFHIITYDLVAFRNHLMISIAFVRRNVTIEAIKSSYSLMRNRMAHFTVCAFKLTSMKVFRPLYPTKHMEQ